MSISYVPLLKIQREIYDVPFGAARFKNYIDVMRGDTVDDMALPLSNLNPMAKPHVAELLDGYLAMGADEIAAAAIEKAKPHLPPIKDVIKVTLVLADDLMGGWTNRTSTDFDHRFRNQAHIRRGWHNGLLWSSEAISAETITQTALAALFRGTYILQHGYAQTLRDMLAQEATALQKAGIRFTNFEDDEIAYTREILAEHLESENQATQIAALYGDKSAHGLGYEPLGLSEQAGFALAAAMPL